MPPDAIEIAEKRNLNIFRLDVSAAIGALIQNLLETEQIVDKKFGRRLLYEESLVSGGLFGKKGEMIVDNVWNPTIVYGISDGIGDFIRSLSENEIQRIGRLQKILENI